MSDRYVHALRLQTRWKDNDVYGHVNNVEYLSWFDTAINAYLIAEGGLDIHAGGVIGLCVESHCAYTGPVAFPEEIEVRLRVGDLGRSSVRYELAIARPAAGLVVATGWFVHVFVDRASRRPVEISGTLREALARLVVAD